MTTAVSAAEREALAASIREVVRKRAGSSAARAAMRATPRTDRALFDTLCADIDAAALPIPTEFGGAGATFAETGIVLEELGRSLTPTPFYAHAVATAAILLGGDDEAARHLLPDLASGTRIATVCWAGGDGWDRPGVTANAGLLGGTAEFVVDGETADLFVVLAGSASSTGGDLTLHIADADAGGVRVTPLPVVDPTRPLSRVSFDDTPSTAIPSGADIADRLRAVARALLSAEQVAGAAEALAHTVEYTQSRRQFGRTIGSFQALKHRMADMYVLVESARSISRASIAAVVADDTEAADIAAAAHVYCSEAFATVAGEGIQMHGGIGITAEHDISLYFKRAHGSAQLFGQPHELVAQLGDGLLKS